MVLFLTLLVAATVCGGSSKSFPLRLPKRFLPRFVEKDLKAGGTDETYDSYYSVEDSGEEEINVISRVQEIDLDKIKSSSFYNINGETYLLMKTVRHRNKRYSSYLTLCPFKICNMGRKRVRIRRFIEKIKPPTITNGRIRNGRFYE